MHPRQTSAFGSVAAAIVALIGCSDFEKPQIVIDLRPLAIVANPSEVVLDVDLDAPNIIESVDLSDLVNVELCGLIADPAADRRINYRFTACEPTRSFRCDEPDDPDDIKIEFGSGSIDDPETSATEQPMCSTLQVTPVLESLLMKMVEQDPRRIVEGVDVQIELRVETEGPDPEIAYARKSARYSARLPIDRVANLNPTVDAFMVTREDGSEETLPLGRCVDVAEPLRIGVGETVAGSSRPWSWWSWSAAG